MMTLPDRPESIEICRHCINRPCLITKSPHKGFGLTLVSCLNISFMSFSLIGPQDYYCDPEWVLLLIIQPGLLLTCYYYCTGYYYYHQPCSYYNYSGDNNTHRPLQDVQTLHRSLIVWYEEVKWWGVSVLLCCCSVLPVCFLHYVLCKEYERMSGTAVR